MARDAAGRAIAPLVVLAGALLLVGGAGVAGACRLTSLNCHLRASRTALSRTSGGVSLRQGLSAEVVASGFAVPTSFDFLPDGRILVAEKDGRVRVVEDGKVSPTPVLDLRAKTDTAFFRGLVDVAVDPDFDRNHFIYVVYTARRQGTASDSEAPTHVLVSRFVLSGSTAGDEHVLLGAAGERTGSCVGLPPTSDCLPANVDHVGAQIVFASDGTMFVSTGDGGGQERVENTAFTSQDVDSLAGKILHVTRDGKGVASNPFFTGDPTTNRSKVWALGFRNPFRVDVAQAKQLIVADVGWRTSDEVDVVRSGSDYGWPCYEGQKRTPRYQHTARCRSMYRRPTAVQAPVIALLHHGRASSLTGGIVYAGNAYPGMHGSYVYGDWDRDWLRWARIDSTTGRLRGTPSEFGEDAGGPVEFRTGPDGRLYVLALNYEEIYRISPTR